MKELIPGVPTLLPTSVAVTPVAPVLAVKKFFRNALSRALRHLYVRMEYIVERDLPRFANTPKNLKIELPRRIFEPHCISIGDNVNIGPGSLLVAQTYYPTETMQHPNEHRPIQHFSPQLRIGHRVTATGNLTLSALQEVVIGDDVMFAANVMVADGMHGFANANEPYKYQPMWRIAPVRIERGCWIGQNVVVMPGVTIGEFSIIGANSVVTQSVPARSIAIGAPARVIKRWDERKQCWSSAENMEPANEEALVRVAELNAARVAAGAV